MLLVALALGACGSSAGAGAAVERGPVAVLYAGSLVDVMQNALAPAFHRATGYTLEGFAAGSQALAHQITGRLRRADVFVSAAPSVNDQLMGKKNGGYVTWYVTFAQAPLVLGYNPNSTFAHALQTEPWYVALEQPGFRLGRTDPSLDPKGALTVQAVQAAQAYYRVPNLTQRILGSAENPSQVFPEEDLVGRLQSGQLDAGFFYENEAVQAGIPIIPLPKALDASANFTITIVRGGADPAGADAFLRFLLGPQGKEILRRGGLEVTALRVFGNRADVPASLKTLLAP